MTKGEIRKARKEARANGWAIEMTDGRPEIVRVRTEAQERRHERRMERWARRWIQNADHDHSMDG